MARGKIRPEKKALEINLDDQIYGSFAEIGAGQEVARNFFQAGKASSTIAKTMSAYDMTVSDAIYGQEENKRYVCQSRLLKMIDHEYTLNIERLTETRGDRSKFFAFASTVAAKTENNPAGHGWLGIKWQTRPGGEPNEAIIHIRMLDERRLHQQQAIGVVGVNLVYTVFNLLDKPDEIVPMLVDYIEAGRIEIDMIRITGPDTEHLNNRLLAIDLIQHSLTKAVIFSSDGSVLQPSDELFRRPILIQRGMFRPVTKTNIEIQIQGLKQFRDEPEVKDQKQPLVFMEMTMQNLRAQGRFDSADFLERIECINALGHEVLISDCSRYFDLKEFLRRHTNQMIGMVIGAASLDKLFDSSFYEDLPGGIMQAMGRLFDKETRLYVYPFKQEFLFTTTGTYLPDDKVKGLYQHLVQDRRFIDIDGCDDVDVTLNSDDVRALMEKGDSGWEELVPEKVRDIIKSKGLVGIKK